MISFTELLPRLVNAEVPLWVSLGGGRNSWALIIGLYRRGIRPDIIAFANTRGEKPLTYRLIWEATAWCLERGFPAPTIMEKGGSDEGLEDVCLRLGTLPSIVTGNRTCSQRFKIEAQERFANHWEPARRAWASSQKVVKAIGYHAGEPYRVKPLPLDEAKKYDVVYPLIEWGWDNWKCLDVLEEEGFEWVPKSACFFCPSSRKHEILALKRDHPDLFERALEMERRALASGKFTNVRGLGRHWSWADLSKADDDQAKLFKETVSIPCVCVDGDDE